jgi:predicted transposase/invertase (TIGR01784 family)
MTARSLISFDWAMKKVLRSKVNFEILEGFLSELIAPDKNLKIIRILDPESNKDTIESKYNRIDILVEIEPNDIVLIEVQFTRESDFLFRTLFGASKIVTEYLSEGEGYAKIRKIYSVNILYFDLGHGEDYIYHGTTEFIGMHNHDHLKLDEKQKLVYKKELISEIYPEYFIIKINNFNDLAKNTLDEWIYFLKNEEIKPGFKAKGLLKAKKELDILKLTENERKIYEKFKDNLHFEASMTYEMTALSVEEGKVIGRKEGLKEGIERGRNKEKNQIAINLLNNNVPIETIVITTGLTEEEINELKGK